MWNNENERISSEPKAHLSHRGLARRELLKASLGVCAGSLAWQAGAKSARGIDYREPVPGSEGLTAYRDGGQVFVRWNNVVVAAYRAHGTQKYPYLTSLAGPVTGMPVTTESSLPYPHHRGIWLGCEPLNGGDYWSDAPIATGQIKSAGPELKLATAESIVISDKCQWFGKDGDSPCADQRKFTFTAPSERLYLLDVDIKLTARQDLTIDGAKHSFFALRAAPDISPSHGGTLVNSEGDAGAKLTGGKPAAWCDYHGHRRARPDIVEGIALMDHPENPWSPCPWLTRAYGHLSPSPFSFLDKPWQLERGKSIRLRYRIAIHAGDPKEANLAQVYKDWVKGVT
jgi:hypothetical protein